MIKICLDTNILISAFLFKGKPAEIFDLVVDHKIIAIVSPAILEEVARILHDKFKRDELLVRKQIKVITNVCRVIAPKTKIKAIKHAPDNRILEAAFAGNVGYIVTGDKKHLLPLKIFRSIPIVTPDQFLKTFHSAIE